MMSYIEQNCLSGKEEILLSPDVCKIKLFWAWVGAILTCWLLLIPVFKAIAYTVRVCNTEYAVTNKKAVEKYGLFSVHCDEMGLDKIENITMQKTFWGSIFHYGSLCIQGTNRNNIVFRNIKNVEEVKHKLNEIHDQSQA